MASMVAAKKIISTTFTGNESTVQSKTVKIECESLCQYHSVLINIGFDYANFDHMGKIIFLQESEKVKDRW